MLKALLRKQMLEIRANYFGGRKGKKKKGQAIAAKNPKAMYILFAFLYLLMMFSLFGLSMLLGDTLFPAGMDWMFFSIMTVVSFLVGIFGSVLSTANALFGSKDNELLLSMPIPPSRIVFVRMIAVYLTGMIYECIVLIPAVVCYLIIGNVTVTGIIFSILTIIILGFLIAAFSCLVGWIVKLISAKLKNQKIIRVFLIIILLAVVYYFQFNASRIFSYLAEHAQEIAGRVHGWGYPLYAAGLGMSGDVTGFLVFTAITAVLFLLAYWAVTKSFAKIALTKMSEKKSEFRRSDIRANTVQHSLFRRELKRFTSSVTYMLNAGLGLVLLIAGAVLLLIKMEDLRNMVSGIISALPNGQGLVAVLAACAVCVITSMTTIAACSISMEGKSIWIYQAMPLDPYRIYRAKISLHVILTAIPAIICALAAGYVFQVDFVNFIMMLVFVFMYIMLTASFELAMDLRKPKMDWTNENQALKTNVNVLAATFAVMLAPLIIGGIYYLAMVFMNSAIYLVIFIAIFAGLTLLIHRWLAGKGRERFAVL